eukprot:PhF_6_TR42764/c0_g1_i1/m.64679/K14379/ACP5; tartrate-resistant acid phosphatase type 5
MICILALLSLSVIASAHRQPSDDTSYNFVVIGDWGGQPTSPFTEKGQIACAKSMGPVAASINSQMVLALGDNFYDSGVPTNEHDPRFKETFEDVYTAASLQTPWYMVAGNHDHIGNISAEIAYSKHNKRWRFPDYYYTFTVTLPFNGMKAQFVMIDTVILSGESYHDTEKNIFVKARGPSNQFAADAQWSFIEKTLKSSTADYLFVAGHYPVYSGCSHGNTPNLVSTLRPLMYKANVTAFLSGHDHCLQYLQDDQLPYILSGAADDCCYPLVNAGEVPPGVLKFYRSQENAHGLYGGYVTMSITAQGAQASYRDQDGNILFTTPSFPPRKKN